MPRRRSVQLALLTGVAAAAVTACGTTVPQVTQLSAQAGTSTVDGGGIVPAPGGVSSASGDGAPTGATGTTPGSATAAAGTLRGTPITGRSAPAGAAGGLPAPAAGAPTAGVATTARPAHGPATSPTAKRPGAKNSGTTASGGTKGNGSSSTGPATSAVGTPIKLGIYLPSSSAAANSALGLSSGNSANLNAQSAYTDLIKAVNAKGGLSGHQVIPDFDTLNTSDASYDSDLQAACAHFTTDDHDAAVLNDVGFFSASFESCLSAAGLPDISAEPFGPDTASLTSYPGLAFPDGLSLDQQQTALFDGLAKTGFLTPKRVIGTIVEDCPYVEATYANTYEPLIRADKLNEKATVKVNCDDGLGSAGTDAPQLSSAVLTFQSQGVDTVFLVSNNAGVALQLFAESADSQGYHPTYAVTSAAAVGVLGSNLSAQDEADIRGVGWSPTEDTDTVVGGAPGQACSALFTSQQVSTSAMADQGAAYAACDTLGFYGDLVAAVNGAPSPGQVPAARQKVGTFTAALTLGNAGMVSQTRSAGAADVAPFLYQSGCGCYKYTTSPYAAP